MDCLCILVLVIMVIIFAMFMCFYPIGKSDRVSGGHKVKLDTGEILHIENYKELKEKIQEKYTTLDKSEVRAKADEIVNNIISKMGTNVGYDRKAAFIDEEIMKIIKEGIPE